MTEDKKREDKKRETHQEYLEGNHEEFLERCRRVGLMPSRRQVSKWRRKEGIAWGSKSKK